MSKFRHLRSSISDLDLDSRLLDLAVAWPSTRSSSSSSLHVAN